MATNIEIEAKVLINANEYENIVNTYAGKVIAEYDQDNYYIDSDNFDLKNIGVGLRVRLKDGIYTLTLKAPMSEGLLEKNNPLTEVQFKALLKKGVLPECDIKEFIKMLGKDPLTLKVQTELITHRKEIMVEDESITFSIDKNKYNNIEDYELECSGNSLSRAKDYLKRLCSVSNILYKDNQKSKETRALESIKK